MSNIPDKWPFPDQFPETPLMPRPDSLDEKVRAVLNAGKFRRARFHKIGGEPDWIQGDETPECCGHPAIFYGQLGSLGGKYDLVDNGRIYVFLCRKCLKAHAVFQFS